MSGKESMDLKGHRGDGRGQTYPNLHGELEPNPPLPQPGSVHPSPGQQQWCYCGNIPPNIHPGGIVYVPYPNMPPTNSQPISTHPTHGGQHPVPQFCYCNNVPPHIHPGGIVYVPYPNMPPTNSQPISTHPTHDGQHPVPQFCYCDNLPPHIHPGGVEYVSYPNHNMPPEDSQPRPAHPTHDGQHQASTEDKGHHRADRSQMDHNIEGPLQPNPQVPQPGYVYLPHGGQHPVPQFCYCDNVPPHIHPRGIEYVSYPNHNMPPTVSQSRPVQPIHGGQDPASVEDKGHGADGSQLHPNTQGQLNPDPPVPQAGYVFPHSGLFPMPQPGYVFPHSGLFPVPQPEYVFPRSGHLPVPQPGYVFPRSGHLPVPQPGYVLPRSGHLPVPQPGYVFPHSRQDPASVEDKEHGGADRSQLHPNKQEQLHLNPPVPQPGYVYLPHVGQHPVPQFCYCDNALPHIHPHGIEYVSYPNKSMPSTDS